MEDFKVNICGVPHKVYYKEDCFTSDGLHLGEIHYKNSEIYICKGMVPELEKQTLIHEMLHGLLLHVGYTKLCEDEQFVQVLAQAMTGCFEVIRM